jgi:3-hydroxy-9,10-secoandrosta-1,3,5(10)-triene-9,17-dione monooxygenase
MTREAKPAADSAHDSVLARVRALTQGIRERATAAEEGRTLPRESVDALFAAGITRILMPRRFGGYGLGFDTWFEVVREIGKADASHAWCASLMIHHPHWLCQFPEEAQAAVWADGPDVAIAASIAPAARAVPTDGGYLISGRFAFASGINHSRWLVVGGMAEANGRPEATFFLLERKDFKIIDCWFTSAMRATGSNDVVCEEVFVPASRTVRLTELREGKGPGGALHAHQIYRAPFIAYAPLTFVAPMLGAAQGAYELFREWTKTRRGGRAGIAVAEITSIQVRLARAAADLDAAELLTWRAIDVAQAPVPASQALRARSMRDYSRATELCVAVIDSIIGMSGTAAFAASHPIQRAWRDIHFAAMHVSLNAETNFAHFGRTELGLPRDPHIPFF